MEKLFSKFKKGMVENMELLNIFKVVINGKPFDLMLNGESVTEVMEKVRKKHEGEEVYFLQMDKFGDFHKID
jgi:hypothetical protein